MKLKTFSCKFTFYTAASISAISIVAFVITAFTSFHFVSNADMYSLTAGSFKIKFITPGLTYFTGGLGLSRATPNPFEWLPTISRSAAVSQLDLPLWLPAITFGLIALFTHRRAFPLQGVCAHCKYSLHGLEDASRCPECGHGIITETSQALEPIAAC